jgi:hypothetical protein
MKAQEEILQSMHMFHNKVKKGSSTKKAYSSRQVTKSISQSRMDDHGNDKKSINMNMHHHSTWKSTRRNHASSGPKRNPRVSLV